MLGNELGNERKYELFEELKIRLGVSPVEVEVGACKQMVGSLGRLAMLENIGYDGGATQASASSMLS